MDAVGDAEYAISAHGELGDLADHGHLYLVHFGFVQALYLQQDGVRHLCECLGFPDLAARVAELDDVKQIRNDLAHMTNRAGHRYIGIVRVSMTSQGFERYSFGEYDLQRGAVVCSELAQRQCEVLATILDDVVARLVDDERRHRAEFRGEKLLNLVGQLGYPIEKITVGARHVRREGDRVVAVAMLGVVDESIMRLEEALARRGWLPNVHPSLGHDMTTVRRCVERLRRLLSPESEPIDAEAMATLLATTLQRVVESATDLDCLYGEEPD